MKMQANCNDDTWNEFQTWVHANVDPVKPKSHYYRFKTRVSMKEVRENMPFAIRGFVYLGLDRMDLHIYIVGDEYDISGEFGGVQRAFLSQIWDWFVKQTSDDVVTFKIVGLPSELGTFDYHYRELLASVLYDPTTYRNYDVVTGVLTLAKNCTVGPACLISRFFERGATGLFVVSGCQVTPLAPRELDPTVFEQITHDLYRAKPAQGDTHGEFDAEMLRFDKWVADIDFVTPGGFYCFQFTAPIASSEAIAAKLPYFVGYHRITADKRNVVITVFGNSTIICERKEDAMVTIRNAVGWFENKCPSDVYTFDIVTTDFHIEPLLYRCISPPIYWAISDCVNGRVKLGMAKNFKLAQGCWWTPAPGLFFLADNSAIEHAASKFQITKVFGKLYKLVSFPVPVHAAKLEPEIDTLVGSMAEVKLGPTGKRQLKHTAVDFKKHARRNEDEIAAEVADRIVDYINSMDPSVGDVPFCTYMDVKSKDGVTDTLLRKITQEVAEIDEGFVIKVCRGPSADSVKVDISF
jgi:hypothetical protein